MVAVDVSCSAPESSEVVVCERDAVVEEVHRYVPKLDRTTPIKLPFDRRLRNSTGLTATAHTVFMLIAIFANPGLGAFCTCT